MPNKTEHYQLNQYQPEDNFLRTDFNEDNAKVDAAIATKCEIVIGGYTGDGQAYQEIALGFRPKAVFVTGTEGRFTGNNSSFAGAMVLDGYPVSYATLPPHIEVVENGFRVYWRSHYNSITLNKPDESHRFLALK